ncbi:MAG: hypothetical protein U0234_27490 [Sandaracinus sp.]
MRKRAARCWVWLWMIGMAACGPDARLAEQDVPSEASAGGDGATLADLAALAVDADASVSDAAIVRLRAAGPEGLAALLEAHATEVERLRTEPLADDAHALEELRQDEALGRLRRALDRVAAQRDAFASGLFWYTDLAAAQAEAARRDRPILSLRLLGRLDEEASCANSRFFRWLLYPDPRVREALAGYVLHWSSERPAPHVTIDMGDGRTIERTITGNSVHYVLDASGHVVDAIAGLHTPEDFVARLEESAALAERCGVRFADASCLASAHRAMLEATHASWDQLRTGPALGAGLVVEPPFVLPSWDELVQRDVPAPALPSAALAMPLTIGKAAIEMPLLRMLGAAEAPEAPPPLPWRELARVISRYDASGLSPASVALARLKTGSTEDVTLARATAERALADTLLARYTHERRFHAWLAEGATPNDFDSINARVYAELFLTPASDPWLGLRAETEWDVLEVEGSTDGRN